MLKILTQEDWNEVLYNAIDTTGPFSFIYFAILTVLGNYILLNLLVAIIVQGFSEVIFMHF